MQTMRHGQVIFFDCRGPGDKLRSTATADNLTTWYFQMKGEQVVKVTAFFETSDFDALLSRVPAPLVMVRR